ncbi:MAG: hypothetical protein CME64_11730 [Halobacteriovoraceae bacterium]|nr:hypothetical protein [Halobacteriovoraceae bacterium]|tara:strand:- start:94867 stop:95493 length:627 start_codon:yes stop_codon:yes gene_type:complete
MKKVVLGLGLLSTLSAFSSADMGNVFSDLVITQLSSDEAKYGEYPPEEQFVIGRGAWGRKESLRGDYCVESISPIVLRENNASIIPITVIQDNKKVSAAIGAKTFFNGDANLISLNRFEPVLDMLLLNTPNTIITSLETTVNEIKSKAYHKAKKDIEASFEVLNYQRAILEALAIYEARCEDSERLERVKSLLQKRLEDSLKSYLISL